MFAQHSGPGAAVPPWVAIAIALVAIIIDLRVAMYFLEDLYKPERRVAGGDKTVWAAIIIFGSVLGMFAYVLFGREN